MGSGIEAQAYSILAITAVVLLVVVTGGVIYLTLIDWQDKRRQSREKLDNMPRKRTLNKRKLKK